MRGLFSKFIAVCLLILFTSFCSDVVRFVSNIRDVRSNADCRCEAAVCCCLLKLNSAEGHLCKTNITGDRSDYSVSKIRNPHLTITHCGAAKKYSVVSAFRQIVPSSSQVLISLFPNFFENPLEAQLFHKMDFPAAVFRPPRPVPVT